MEGTLLVTPEKLQSTASSFQSKAAQVKSLHDNMISKVNSLSSSWTGEAASAYNSKFNDPIAEFVCGCPILPIKTTAPGPAPIQKTGMLPSVLSFQFFYRESRFHR